MKVVLIVVSIFVIFIIIIAIVNMDRKTQEKKQSEAVASEPDATEKIIDTTTGKPVRMEDSALKVKNIKTIALQKDAKLMEQSIIKGLGTNHPTIE